MAYLSTVMNSGWELLSLKMPHGGSDTRGLTQVATLPKRRIKNANTTNAANL